MDVGTRVVVKAGNPQDDMEAAGHYGKIAKVAGALHWVDVFGRIDGLPVTMELPAPWFFADELEIAD